MTITYSNIQVTKVLTLRGNTIQNNRYTGLSGELTVDTEAKTIRIHDGVTPGGNVIQGATGASSYGNANVHVYLSNFDGNIVPSAGNVYSLGSPTKWWKDLWISNNTIYVGGIPISTSGGNLTVGGNVITSGPNLATYSSNISASALTLSGAVGGISSAIVDNGGKGFSAGLTWYTGISQVNGALCSVMVTASTSAPDRSMISVGIVNPGNAFHVGDLVTVVNDNTPGNGYPVSNATIIVTEIIGAPKPAIYVGNTAWDFGADGTLTTPGNIVLPDSSAIYSDANSTVFTSNILTDNTGISLTDNGNAAVYANDNIVLETNTNGNVSNQWSFSTDGTLTIPNGGKLGGLQYADGIDLYANGTMSYAQVNYNNTNYIYTDSGVSALQTPNAYVTASTIENRVIVQATNPSLSQDSTWTFYSNGNLIFPDSTVQTTAFSNAAVSSYLADSTLKTFGDGVTITGNLTVQGNIIFNGNATLVSTNNLIINDNIIYIANANPGSSLDIGFAGHFTSTRYQHTGLIRQASTNQWQLFSNVVPEPGGTVDFTNAIYDDIRVGNITSPTITGINANVTAANVGIKGYVDLANSIQSSQISAANVGIIGYIDLANTIQSGQVGAANLAITAANVGIKGYIDLANSIQSAQISAANVGIIGYIDQGNSIQATAITTANTGMKGYVDSQTFYSNASVATYLQSGNIANISAAGNVTATYFVGNGALLTGIAASSNYSNVQVATYLPTYTGVVTASNVAVNGNITAQYLFGNGSQLTGLPATYSNVQVATYLPTYTGNIANIRLGVAGVLTFPDGTTQTTAAAGGGTSYSNVNVAAYLATGLSSNIVVTTGAYFVGNVSATTTMQYGAGQGGLLFTKLVGGTGAAIYSLNVTPSALNYAFSTNGAAVNFNAPTGGGIYTSINNSIVTTVTAGYLNVAGNVSAANVSAQYLFGDGSNLTNMYSNVNVTNYLPTHLGNVGVNTLLGTTPNVTLAANSYSTTYDIYGNVAFGNAAYPVQISATGNISTSGYLFGNGAFLTGIVTSGGGSGTNYSNVNVKAYTETMGFQNYGNVNVAAFTSGLTNYSNVNVAAYLNTQGYNLYSNVNVAAYLNTQGYNLYSNVNVAAYLSTATINTTGNITAAYISGNISITGNVTGTSPNVTIQAGSYSSVFDNQGNVTVPRLFTAGNIQTAGYLFGNGAFLTGVVTSGGGNYSNVDVTNFLANSSATFIGNTGNVSSVYPLQSNITQVFIGNQTTLTSGAGLTTNTTYLTNNIYFLANGAAYYRNTQTGAAWMTIAGSGITFAGTSGAVTANTAQTMGSWASLSSSGFVTQNSLGITSAGTLAVNGSGGITTTQGTFPLVNSTATAINFGGAATVINMGSTGGTGNVFFGGNAIIQAPNGAVGTNLYPLVLRPAGQFNYLLLTNSQGGYNSPPYAGVSPTGGTGNGMVISFSSVGGYISQSSLVVTNAGSGYRNGDILTIPGGLGTTVLLSNYNAAKLSNTAAASYTFGFDGNLTLPGNIIFPSSSYIFGDFSNATVNSRTVFMTTGNSATTGIYAAPSGTATGAAWQAANSANLTNASKIMITTNGSTDVQLVSGINGTGTYLPLSFYNNGSAQMQLTVAGNLNMTVNNSIATSGTGYFIGNAVGTTAAYTGNVTVGGNLTVSGNLSANLLSITANSITGTGANTYIVAGAYTSTFDNAGNVVLPNAYVSGNVVASYFVGNGALLTGIVAGSNYSNVQVATYLPTYTGVVTASNVAVNGNITAQYLFGNAAFLTGIAASSNYSNVQVATYLPTYTGNISAGNISVTGNVSAGTFVGNVVASAISNPVTNSNTTITAGSYTTTFDTLGNVTVQGNVVANYLFGNGFYLTGVVTSGGGSSNYSNTNVIAYLAGNITTGNITTIGNVNANYFVGTQVGNSFGTTATFTGNVSAGNISTAGNVTASYLVGTQIGNSVGTTATYTGNVTGNYFVGNLSNNTGNVYVTNSNIIVGVAGYTVLPTTVAQFTGNANTYTQMNIENVSSGSNATAEYVATANNGTDNTFFVDLGIANSNYNVNAPNNSLGTTIYPNDSYLYAQGNLATTTGGNLAIGTSTPNKSVKIFAGGINSANIVATVSNIGVAVTGDVTTTGNVTATGNITATGYIVTAGGFGNISQVDYITANNVVATANVTVQGIGVTMPNRPAFRINGTSLYGGSQSTANVNLKGVAVSTAYNQGSYFDATTGKFTAPIAGIYEVLLNARVNSSFNGLGQLVVLKNGLNTSGNIVAFWETSSNIGGATHFGVSGTVVLAAGDYLSANILAGNITFDQNDNWSVTYLG